MGGVKRGIIWGTWILIIGSVIFIAAAYSLFFIFPDRYPYQVVRWSPFLYPIIKASTKPGVAIDVHAIRDKFPSGLGVCRDVVFDDSEAEDTRSMAGMIAQVYGDVDTQMEIIRVLIETDNRHAKFWISSYLQEKQ